MSIYKKLLDKSKENGRFKIDLNKKNLVIGRKNYIKDGELCVDEELITDDELKELGFGNKNCFEIIKSLYKEFKYSVPSENDGNNYYFKPLPYSDLTDGDLAYGKPRCFAQAMLEGFVLIAVLKNIINWPDETKWFWQDDEDKDLIIMKQWIM